MPVVKLNSTFVSKLEYSGKQEFYWDSSLEGFGICVGAKHKTAYVQTRQGQKGKSLRSSIGRISEAFTFAQAREHAKTVLGDMVKGLNPIEERRIAQIAGITFQEAFNCFLDERDIKEKTIKDYRNIFNAVMSDWHNKPVRSFGKEDVLTKYKELENRPGYANLWARTMRSFFNFCADRYDFGYEYINPIKSLSTGKKWKKLKPRKSYIKDQWIKPYFEAINTLTNQDFADYFRLISLTGIRSSEALSLRWERVDFANKIYKLVDPKNGNDVELPLSDYLCAMLLRRYQNKINQFVFPGNGKTGHLVEPKNALKNLVATVNTLLKQEAEKQGAKEGITIPHNDIKITSHDLRRTFSTVGNTIKIDKWTLKALMNHVVDTSDVTSTYVQIPPKQLRNAHTKINNYILKKAGII